MNANLRKRDIEVRTVGTSPTCNRSTCTHRTGRPQIKDLYKDLSDGLVLIALTEVLTGKEFDRKKLNEQPATIHHKIDVRVFPVFFFFSSFFLSLRPLPSQHPHLDRM